MLKKILVATAMLVYLCSSQSYADVVTVSGTVGLSTATDTLSIDGDSFELTLDLTGSTIGAFGGPFVLAPGNSIDVSVGGTNLVGPLGPGAVNSGGLLINSGANQGLIIGFPATTAGLEFQLGSSDITLFTSNIEFTGFTAPAVGDTLTAAAFDSATIGVEAGDAIIRFTDGDDVDTDYTLTGLSFSVAAVPEPSTFMVLGAMSGILLVRRKR